MKFCEALSMLQRDSVAYVVEDYGDGYGYSIVYSKDKEGNFRSTYIINAIRGNQGYLLSFVYYNAESTQKLLKDREFTVCYSYKELFNDFIEREKHIDNTFKTYSYEEVTKMLKSATKKGKVSSEDAKELLNRYSQEVLNV